MDNTQSQDDQPAKPISDDQELAKVLAGIGQEFEANKIDDTANKENDLPDIPTTTTIAPTAVKPNVPNPDPSIPGMPGVPAPSVPIPGIPTPSMPVPGMPMPGMPITDTPKDDKNFDLDLKMPDFTSMMPPIPSVPGTSNNLESIRKDALLELRPLVDKLDLSPEEKFDIYLLLLRSTDDTTLIAPAHEAAKNIVDEARRAEALLNVIKEIDFLSAPTRTE